MASSSVKLKMLPVLFLVYLILFSGCAGTSPTLKEIESNKPHKNWDTMVRLYQKAYEEDPENTEIKLGLERAKWNASMGHMEKGEALLKKGHYDEAITELQMAIAFYPGNTKAARLIQKARNSQQSIYYTTKGNNYYKAHKYFEAQEAFERALALNPESEGARKGLALLKKKIRKHRPKYILKPRTKGPISLKFKKTPVSNVFEVLSRLSGINFIFDKDMQDPRVTLFMTDVSFDHFLKVLLRTSGLAAKVVDQSTVIIYPDTPSKAKEYQDLQIRTFYLSHLDVKKAVALLAKIVKTKDVIANEKANAVVVRGTKEQIEIASKLIDANDRPPAEILLNVEVLEVSRSKERQLGVEFNPTSITFGIGEAASKVSSESSFAERASVYALDRLSAKELLVSLPTVTLNLLKQDADTRILANPQIRVKNGEKAKILVGERVPLRVNRRIDTTGVVTNDYQYQEIGIKLKAEPMINMHDEVTLKLNIEVSALGPNLGTADEPQYSILTRTANSTLTVRDSYPVIIGGLVSDQEKETVRKIPFLGDIPALGHLFTNYDTKKVKTDIIMTITPVVLKSQEIPGKEVTQIWSGKERSFSLEEPYESLAERRMAYVEEPKKEVKKKGKINTKKYHTKGTPQQKRPVVSPTPVPKPPPAKDIPKSNVAGNPSIPKKVAGPHGAQPREKNKSTAPWSDEEETFTLWPPGTRYSIHVGSYVQKKEAELCVKKFQKENYECFVIPVHVSGKGFFYRVFVGRFNDLYSAKVACEQYKKKKIFSADIHVVSKKWAFGG